MYVPSKGEPITGCRSGHIDLLQSLPTLHADYELVPMNWTDDTHILPVVDRAHNVCNYPSDVLCHEL